MISKSLNEFDNRFPGKKLAIVAPGPSLSELKSLDSFEAAIFVGDAHLRTKLRSVENFYVRANTEYPRLDVPEHFLPLILEKFHIILASSVMESQVSVEELSKKFESKADITLFDQKHFFGAECRPQKACCKSIIRPTIQEFLAERIGWHHHYSPGSTVLLHALAIAILTNPREITIFGAALPLRQHEYTYLATESQKLGTSQMRQSVFRVRPRHIINLIKDPRSIKFRVAALILGNDQPSVFAQDFVQIISDLQYLADAAGSKSIAILNATRKSTLNSIAGFRFRDSS
jgi:hypothetical protein